MKSIKRLIQVILVSTSFLILSGCFSSFSQDDLNQPIQEYLKTNYGIQDEFSVIRTDNTFNGIGHQTYVEIKKPYRAYPFLMIEKYTFKILEDESDDIYFQQFKGAYIEQHPEVVQVMKQIIKKYGLVKYPGKADPEENGPIRIFPYDNIEFNINNSQELLDNFKKTQKIDTTELLPTLIPSDPRREYYNGRYVGVVNFLFRFDMNKNKHPIPKAKDLIEDFQKSGILTKGIYNIDMFVDDSNPDHFIGWEYNNVALFEVNENGKYTVIATPNYDDIRDTYFYGDYATKKNIE
ncbi:hypothetical protein [Bacillus thuringiensis]|uniref:hypothetical protein n=1 Tax=Bacillus thuringiensis TaxID=1428 RepID=UPI000BEE2280|nr:hypothetical protein [Bacillus thuringiensis]MCC6081049.1 hypothetical protein [Bacillus thuringiensis]PEB12756.1 hypothetical protein COM67_10830 [Bacillus thuringiensis]PEB69939.1 hypothetical protein COM91_10435 [Bacillus thuringiensis]PEQ54195.1 hypothetical protein CN473_09640 [Bacillus thuringiensis]PEY85848.1 hypothetical protein CN351_07765 [Bacillus thuringiensis]